MKTTWNLTCGLLIGILVGVVRVEGAPTQAVSSASTAMSTARSSASSSASSTAPGGNLTCEKAGKAYKLRADIPVNDGASYYYSDLSTSSELLDGPFRKFVGNNDTTEKYEFWNCTAPSNDFSPSHHKALKGQIRKEGEAGMCLTVKEEYDGEYGNADYDVEKGLLTLEPCKGIDDINLSLQWFGHFGSSTIGHVGKKKDTTRLELLFIEGNQVAALGVNISSSITSFKFDGRQPINSGE